MAEDPYHLLGVSRTASDEEVRKAYRRLVKELHPDVNPARAAEERFKKITAAFDIIGDPERRRQYDRGEIDAGGEPRRQAYRAHAGPGANTRWSAGGSIFNSEDPFSDLFSGLRGARTGFRGAGFATRGQDVRYTLDVEFLEAATGTKRRVTMPGGGVLEITVPEGVNDGQVLRLKGRGAPGVDGGEPGDAMVEIRIRQHAFFKRQGDDILHDCPVTIDEAVLGGRIEVPTISGRVQITIPKGTNSGTVFRLKGKGVRSVTAGTTGDQLVSLKIVMPTEIDESMSYFMTEWRQKHRYDPGRK